MSLEDKISTLTKVLEENNDLLRVLTAKAKAAVDNNVLAKEPVAPAESTSRGRGRPAGSKNKTKVPTAADMKTAVQDFLNLSGEDEEDYQARKAFVKKLNAKFNVEKFTEIPDDSRQSALDSLNNYETESDEDQADDEVV